MTTKALIQKVFFVLLRSIKAILVDIPTTYLFPYQLKSCFPFDTQWLLLGTQNNSFSLSMYVTIHKYGINGNTSTEFKNMEVWFMQYKTICINITS